MSSTNKTTYYELSQYVGSDKPTYLGDYNADMLKIDTGLHAAADAADTAVTTANAANSAATSASTTASTALSTAQSASSTASQAQTTAETASTNATAAMSAASAAETAAAANTITNLAPAYDATLTYNVGDLVSYIDSQGSGKLYKCIVAVTTPEAFNINKWDDVTTSEVFASKGYVFKTVNFESTDTRATILSQLTDVLNLDNKLFARSVMIIEKDNGYEGHFTPGSISDTNAFYATMRLSPTRCEIESWVINETEPSSQIMTISTDSVGLGSFTNNQIGNAGTITIFIQPE